MKKFSVMPEQTLLYEHIVPKNAIYGRIAFSYDRREKIGERFVYNKDGEMIFTEDGEPVVRNIYKSTRIKTGCVYSLEEFKGYTHKDTFSLNVWILYDNSRRWRQVHLGDTTFTRMLQDFILNKMREWIRNGYKFDIPDDVKSKIVGQPMRRDVQKQYIFNGRPGYATNPNIINENVKSRTPIIHTNLKSCKDTAPKHEKYASPYQWEYGKKPKKSGNIEIVAAMNK